MAYEQPNAVNALALYIEQFIKERLYLKNVTPATVSWYRNSFKAFAPVLGQDFASQSALRAALIEHIGVVRNEGRGNQAVSINTYLRVIRTFFNWCHESGHLKDKLKVEYLKEEEKVLAPFSPSHIKAILHYKPQTGNQRRVHTIALLILDTGLRITEVLQLMVSDLDFENLLIKVKGKGQKHRLVPMSFELRKILFRWSASKKHLLFPTKYETRIRPRDFLRDFKKMCKRLGITGVRTSPHTLRHTFATEYLKAGGNIYKLSRMLGHSTIKTTERYLHLQTADLAEEHQRLTLLAG